jgi:hypothetical protein
MNPLKYFLGVLNRFFPNTVQPLPFSIIASIRLSATPVSTGVAFYYFK